ncbi:Gfo/Idh/MocA family protein [Acuticoccus kandeliae]|uniref:Gfo/Idh/MocA family protein n=1 Tax=Acuticoccus kandeliae TaxID=2073160 RepID=UPI000D3E034A|nr:Gfo/Idh/MocA family oxidoreductase [Acuticoccus kandeliae]
MATAADQRRETPIRFGLCGTGPWARDVQLPCLMAAEGVSLVAVHGRNADARGALCSTAGVAGFDDFDAMLAVCDAVCFAVPPQVQDGLALRAAEAGRHILLEKPVSRDPATAAAIVEAVERRGLRAACNLSRLAIPAGAAFLDAAAVIAPTRGHVIMRLSSVTTGSAFAASPWRREPEGALWDLGPHALSMLITGLGPVERVAACTIGPAGTTLALDHARGTSTVELSMDAPTRLEEYVFGSDAGEIAWRNLDYSRRGAFEHTLADMLGRPPGTPSPTLALAAAITGTLARAMEIRSQ